MAVAGLGSAKAAGGAALLREDEVKLPAPALAEEAALRELERTFVRWRRAAASLAATPDASDLSSNGCIAAAALGRCAGEGGTTSAAPAEASPSSSGLEADSGGGAHGRARADVRQRVAVLVEALVAEFRAGKERGAGTRPRPGRGAEDVDAGLGRLWEVREEWGRRVEEAREDGEWELGAEELICEMEAWARSTVRGLGFRAPSLIRGSIHGEKLGSVLGSEKSPHCTLHTVYATSVCPARCGLTPVRRMLLHVSSFSE